MHSGRVDQQLWLDRGLADRAPDFRATTEGQTRTDSEHLETMNQSCKFFSLEVL